MWPPACPGLPSPSALAAEHRRLLHLSLPRVGVEARVGAVILLTIYWLKISYLGRRNLQYWK